ncbi:ZIP family zinc transporter [Bacillus mesophilus]|uniref:ZIP family metal transporter n=1 Tax=Bacillus mesophilus TaxID=1808955 RepID=A0A6M0QAJ9_9BACI|nr:ZIP family metal transporter [Bacillus mesophilus]MBM7662659.1 ZIP family zinc transporter [Bacillus mesophilus]NEY73277.1 ZIP family metal transporter [Bacillus mesophilus]
MIQAILWGGLAGSSLVLGAILGIYKNIPNKVSAFIMAYGTGVLIGAATFELLTDAVRDGGILYPSIGFLLGALAFIIAELLIMRKGGHERKRSKVSPAGHSGLAIFIGSIMDAIPESTIIGVSLLEGHSVSWVIIIAIFVSNFPEGLSSSIGMKKDGYSKKKILSLWLIVMLLSSVSSLLGYVLIDVSSLILITTIGAFAAGGIFAMVSSTMLPEAFEEGGPLVGFISALGLLTALILTYYG